MNVQIAHYIKLILAVTLTAIGVAVTYTIFEEGVSRAIELIWQDWLHTDETRWLIAPIIFICTGIFFWLLHVLDRRDEDEESHGLGSMPAPTLVNFAKVLLIGFFSLIAGASLGPEAVLVPACTLLGAYFGTKLFSTNKQDIALMAGMGIIALFTAFFHSYIIGILTIFLVKKQTKANITPLLIILSVGNAVLTYYILTLIDHKGSFTLPAYRWALNFSTIAWSLALVVAGYIAVRLMSSLHDVFRHVYVRVLPRSWWVHAIAAASGLTLLYLIGGPLVQFTGNHSIVPLFEQATTLGVVGLIWILVVKTTAIAWSKAIGYHGGMIFPTIFLASTCVALLQLFVPEFNLIYGLIATLVGAFIANARTGVLA